MSLSLLDSARMIYEAALRAVKPERLVRDKIVRDGLRLIVEGEPVETAGTAGVDLLAVGKAARAMAGALVEILGDLLREGLVVGLPGADPHPDRLTFMPGSHPLPDARSVAAGRAALDLAGRTGPGRLLLAAFSGGGSALACAPAPGIRLEDKVRITAALLARGAAIGEMNAVRKHLSSFKGGQLARAAAPAAVLNVLLSDVAGDDPGTIASGPGYPDATTFAQSAEILSRFGIDKEIFPAVWARLEEGMAGRTPETPKPGDPLFSGVRTFVIGRNADALEAARRAAEGGGFEARVKSGVETGDVRDAARAAMAAFAVEAAGRSAGRRPLCRISGGEHTVRVRGKGKGGRNQEFVLASFLELGPRLDPEGRLAGRDWHVLSLGTDGIDGPTDAAGAWAGPETWRRVRSLGLDPAAFLEDSDSHSFFRAAGGLILTGPTGTNVMDLRLVFLT
jgi:glycerate 2-kinase